LAAVTSAGRAAGLEPLELSTDSLAAAALYQRHSGRVFGYCLSRLGRREDAEDAVQTTFLHAVRGLRRGVVPATEIAWLLGIARNVCLTRWESVGRRSRLESPCDPGQLDRGRAAPQGRREELIGLEDALSQLPEQQRLAVVLRDWRGLSYDEVAAQLGVSRAAVETLIFRGRRTLAGLLREEPQATRRRLRSLGDLGSILSAVKAFLTGGAAATKIAATAVTVAALSGAGAVVGTSGQGAGPAPLDVPATKRATAGLVASVAPERTLEAQSPARRPPASRETPARRAPAPAVAAVPSAAPPTTAAHGPIAATPAGEAPVQAPPSSPPSSEPQRAPQPIPSQPAAVAAATPPVEELLPAVIEAVEETVAPLLPVLPITVPPVTVPPIEVPPVTITVPPIAVPPVVTVPPVTVTLPPVTLPPIVVIPPRP
jgi:RNA polymerase sigma factor (sigma-70 family)